MTTLVDAGLAADLAPGATRAVTVGGERLLLCRTVEGAVWAVADACSHDGSPLGDGALDGDEVVCPRHGARFDVRSGRATRMPAVAPLETYPVREAAGRLWVDL